MVGLGWQELFILLGLLAFFPFTAFWIWTLVDAFRVPDDSHYRSGSKLVWVLVIVFTGAIGSLLYLGLGRPVPGELSRDGRGRASSEPAG